MNKAITYMINTFNDDDIRTGSERRSYTPTLADAKEWNATSEKFAFVLDLLELGLATEGEPRCTLMVEAVEDAYDNLLGR